MPEAELAWEPGRIDLGKAVARPFLDGGWSRDERAADHRFVWGTGTESGVSFRLARARELVFAARVRPFGHPDLRPELPPQELKLLVGDREISTHVLDPGFQIVEATIPAELLRTGENRLRFAYARASVPRDLGLSRDRRQLAVAWDWIRLGEGTRKPQAADEGLELPGASRADFFLHLPEDAWLVADHVLLRRASALLLTVENDAGERLVERLGPGPAALPLEVSGPVRLRLEPVAADGFQPEQVAVFLRHPTICAAENVGRITTEIEDRNPSPGDVGKRPNLILYVSDTLRADHLGARRESRPLTPSLDRLAEGGVVFERMVAQSSYTKASTASIFTGLWPAAHGTNSVEEALPPELPTLPRLLRRGGYDTAAFVANAYVSAPFGFAEGFDRFHFLRDVHSLSDQLHEPALAWLDERGGDPDPFFLYLHTIDPHGPYAPPEPFRSRFAPHVPEGIGTREHIDAVKRAREELDETTRDHLRALYAADVAQQDAALGRFVDGLVERGLHRDSVLVFTSDHGEAFSEHGRYTHGFDLHGEVIRVPLLLAGVGVPRGLRITAPAQHVDLLPTLLDLAGIGRSADFSAEGRSLLRLLEGNGSSPERLRTFHHIAYFSAREGAVIDGRWKLVAPLDDPRRHNARLYDLRRDPGETTDVSAEHPIRAAELAAHLQRKLRTSGPPAGNARQLDRETRDQLRALGYLE